MDDMMRDTGIYYGYPKCCIKEFLSDVTIGIMFVNKRNRRKRTKVAKNGFVPCKKHARLINRKEIKIESLIKNRICPIPFSGKLYQPIIGRF
jgi:hypothetical protein